MLERILIPLDGSELAERVLPYAAELSVAFGSTVTILGVFEPDEGHDSHAFQVYLRNQAEQLAKAAGSNIKTEVTAELIRGRPGQAIFDFARKNDVDIIMMTSHGRSGIRPWPFGGTVFKGLQGLSVPTLIVKVNDASRGQSSGKLFNPILVPLDGSAKGEAILPYVREMARRLSCEVILVQVVVAGEYVHTIGGLDYVRFKDVHIESAKENALRYLEKVKSELGPVIVRTEVSAGDPVQEIMKCAERSAPGLIAMTTHGHSGLERWTFGSVAYKVLHSTQHPLLLVKSTSAGST